MPLVSQHLRLGPVHAWIGTALVLCQGGMIGSSSCWAAPPESLTQAATAMQEPVLELEKHQDPLFSLAQRLVGSSANGPDVLQAGVPTRTAEANPKDLSSGAQAATANPAEMSAIKSSDQIPLGPRSTSGTTSRGTAQAMGSGLALWSWGSVVQTLAALALVLGLIFLLRWLLRQWAGPGTLAAAGGTGGKVVDVLWRSAISSKSSLLLLRVGHRLLVVNDTPTGMNPLASIEDPDEIATILSLVHAQRPGSISGQFRQMLDHFNGKYEGQLHPQVPKTLADLDDPGQDETEIVTDRSRDEVSSLLARLRRMNREVPET